MNKNFIETITGAVVLAIAAWFLLFFAKQNTELNISRDHYTIVAKFEQADGVSVGTPVRIGGIKVGVITSQTLDPNTYFAVLKLSIEKEVKIPQDSIAKIVSDGLIGNKYLAIVPGASDEMVTSGEEMKYTQSSINLESLIGKMIFSKGDK